MEQRQPRRRALISVAVAVALVAQAWDVVASSSAQALPETFAERVAVPEQVPGQVPPGEPSGAAGPYPLNHTFDAKYEGWAGPSNADFEVGDALVGVPPPNHDFEAAPVDAPLVPNGDFESGTFSDWAFGSDPTLLSDPDPGRGWWAELDSNDSVTSGPLELSGAAQAVVYDIGYVPTIYGDSHLKVDVLSGPDFATATRIKLDRRSAPGWATSFADVSAFAGQTIKLRFVGAYPRLVGLDAVRVHKVFPGWQPTGGLARRVEPGGNAYVEVGGNGVLTSGALDIDPSAQQIRLRVRQARGSTDQYRVWIAPGPEFTSFTSVATSTAPVDWETISVNVSAYQGQQIKVRVTSQYGSVAYDDVGIPIAVLPGWAMSGAFSRVEESGNHYVSMSGNLTSEPVTLDGVQQLGLRARSGGSSIFYLELLRGPDLSTVTTVTGPEYPPEGEWQTYKVPVGAYAGETVKLRVRQYWGTGHYDDVGLGESVLPGWTLTAGPGSEGGLAFGDNGYGSYVETFDHSGVVYLRSSDVSTGAIRQTYTAAYEVGAGGPGGSIWIYWVDAETGSQVQLDVWNTSGGAGYRTKRMSVYPSWGTRGYFRVKLLDSARIYSIADNAARQHASEPFSRRIGRGVDTTTGGVSFEQQDVSVTGAIPLAFTRYYTAHSDGLGPLGYRWAHTYDTRLVVLNPSQPQYSNVDVLFGSGREERFTDDYPGYTPVDPRVHSELERNADSTFALTTTTNLTYHFTADGVLTSINDLNGNALTLGYDPQGRLGSVTDDAGRSLTLSYDVASRLASVTDPTGATFTYGYDLAGDLVSVTDPDGGVRTYTYDRHRVTQVVDETGATEVAHVFDDVNRVVEQTDALGHTIQLAYDTPGQGATTVTDPEGGVATYYFDAEHRTTDAVDPQGNVIGYRFDADGNLDKIIDPASNQWAFAYDAGDLTTWTDPLGNPISFTYNPQHLPTTVQDARGNTTTIAYDQNGNRTSVTDPLGNTTTYTYDGQGNVLTETNPVGETWTYTYDSAGNQTSKTNPLGHTWTATYDAAGRLTSETDPVDNTTTYVRDLLGRIVAIREPDGTESNFLYDAVGHLLLAEDPTGAQTLWDYDTRGMVESKTDPAGQTTTYTYDANRRMVSMTGPIGATTTWAYDDVGNLVTETDPTGATTTYTYDPAGRLTSETDPVERTTVYGYDDSGRLIERTLPNGGVEAYAYDADDNLTSRTDPLERVTTFGYDELSRLTSTTDPADATIHYTYDDASRLVSVSDPLERTTSYAYDDAGQRTSVTDPDDAVTAYAYDDAGRLLSVTDPTDRATTYAYDPGGRVVTTTAPGGGVTTNTYDAAGRLESVTQPSGALTSYAYDPRGLLTSATDPLGGVTSYGYDAAGRRTTETDPLQRTTMYGYDLAGRLTGVTDAAGSTVTFAYDAAGQQIGATDTRGHTTAFTHTPLGDVATKTDPLDRTTTHSYDAAGQRTGTTDARDLTVTYTYDPAGRPEAITAPGETITFTYDAAGQRTAMSDATGQTTYTYSLAGHLTQVAAPGGTLGYGYDPAGRRTSLTYPGDRTVDYTHDPAGRLATLTDWNAQATSFGYDADGNRTSIERPNDVDTAITYDAAGRPTDISYTGPAGALQTFAYTYDAAGNRTSTTSPEGTQTYTLDQLNRLTTVTYPDATTASWTYDATGNRTAETTAAGTTTYTYDDAGQLTTTTGPGGTTTYTYDANGNVTAAGSDTFSWDWANRLVGATAGGADATYTYNADDTRTGATIDGNAKTYLNDTQAGLPTVVDDGPRTYLHADGPLATIPDDGNPKYPLADGLGSIRGITNTAGDLTGTADYAPFGAERATTGDDVGLFGYTGEPADATNLVNLRARHLDPTTGRFLSVDTVQPNAPGTQGWNPYTYVANNPTTWTDPTGHFVATPVGFAGVSAMLLLTVPGSLTILQLAALGFLVMAIVFYCINTGCLDPLIQSYRDATGLASNSSEGIQSQDPDDLGNAQRTKPTTPAAPLPSPGQRQPGPPDKDECSAPQATPVSWLPDDTWVVRGGENTEERWRLGAECIDDDGLVVDVSVNSYPGRTVEELSVGIRNGQIGVSTVGAVRAAGGDVIPDPLDDNPYHALVSGLTPAAASALFTPTRDNPSR